MKHNQQKGSENSGIRCGVRQVHDEDLRKFGRIRTITFPKIVVASDKSRFAVWSLCEQFC